MHRRPWYRFRVVLSSPQKSGHLGKYSSQANFITRSNSALRFFLSRQYRFITISIIRVNPSRSDNKSEQRRLMYRKMNERLLPNTPCNLRHA